MLVVEAVVEVEVDVLAVDVVLDEREDARRASFEVPPPPPHATTSSARPAIRPQSLSTRRCYVDPSASRPRGRSSPRYGRTWKTPAPTAVVDVFV